MATISAFVTGPEDLRSAEGSECIRDFLIDGEPTAEELPQIGQPYTAQSSWPSSNFRVSSYKVVGTVRNSGGVWVDVMRVVGRTNARARMDSTSRVGIIEKAMPPGEQFQVTAEMLGARQATDEDVGRCFDPYLGRTVRHVPGGTLYNPIYLDGIRQDGHDAVGDPGDTAEDMLWSLNPSGNPCKRGEWIYRDARPRAYVFGADADMGRQKFYWYSAASAGAKDTTFCPIVKKSDYDDTELTCKMIGRSFFMPAYTVAFYVRTDSYYMLNVPHYPNNGRVTDWGPNSGKKYGPPVHSGAPSEDGDWRIVTQGIEGMTDDDGNDLLKITRSFLRVPYVFDACIWNPNIYPVWTNTDWD